MDTAAAAASREAKTRRAMDSFRDLEFMHFSDQIRLQTTSLSLSDTIWTAAADDDRRNLETAASAAASVLGAPDNSWKTDLTWKPPFPSSSSTHKLAFGHTPSSDRYNNNNNNNNQNLVSKPTGGFFNSSSNYNGEVRDYFGNKSIGNGDGRRRNYNSSGFGEGKGSVGGKKKKSGNGNSNDNGGGGGGGAVDKRFKTLPPSEALPRSEAVGGYIFVCNNDTMQENLKRELFGLPPRYRDSVRAITPGLPLFLYNYSTHQLHGIFEAASFGGTNIDPTAWEDKKCAGESRFPAQVKVMTRKICGPLEEDSFRPILHHYDGPKFRLELSIPEALALLDIFSENNA